MSIRIDRQKCTGCGRCRAVCPGSLLYGTADGRTEIRYPKDCWGCTACVKECRFGAVQYYLGAALNGRGGYMYTRQDDKYLYWIMVKADGTKQVITIDKRQANTY